MARKKARDRVPSQDRVYLRQLRYILHALLMKHDSFGLFGVEVHRQAKNLQKTLINLGIQLSDVSTDDMENNLLANFQRLLIVFCDKNAYGLWGGRYSAQRLVLWTQIQEDAHSGLVEDV